MVVHVGDFILMQEQFPRLFLYIRMYSTQCCLVCSWKNGWVQLAAHILWATNLSRVSIFLNPIYVYIN